MNKTNIEYLDYSWNPIKMRCSPVSEGCQNCWHLAMCDRFYPERNKPVLDEKELEAPIKIKKPSIIGVQFMGDLFHESLYAEDLYSPFDIMEKASQHTFIILTKRPKRMKSYLKTWANPLTKNVWLGVSVENQQTSDERIPILMQIPAAKRFVSVEPILEEVDLFDYLDALDWIICGHENAGRKSRICSLDAVRNLRDQCVNADIPFFLKQLWIDGKLVKMPKLDGNTWEEKPV